MPSNVSYKNAKRFSTSTADSDSDGSGTFHRSCKQVEQDIKVDIHMTEEALADQILAIDIGDLVNNNGNKKIKSISVYFDFYHKKILQKDEQVQAVSVLSLTPKLVKSCELLKDENLSSQLTKQLSLQHEDLEWYQVAALPRAHSEFGKSLSRSVSDADAEQTK
eukprot:Platyproteum_vivax@DN14974_c0_g1_i1.p1